MMQVTCDKCGKIYKVDENKIKGEKARLRCKACENIIIVTKPKPGETPFEITAEEQAAGADRDYARAAEFKSERLQLEGEFAEERDKVVSGHRLLSDEVVCGPEGLPCLLDGGLSGVKGFAQALDRNRDLIITRPTD